MQIDLETVRKIAHLSRLQLSPQEEEEMCQDLSKILTWMEQLNELDTSEVEPLRHMTLQLNNWREDVVEPHLEHKRALANAPKKDSDYIRVPKVIE